MDGFVYRRVSLSPALLENIKLLSKVNVIIYTLPARQKFSSFHILTNTWYARLLIITFSLI